MGDHAPLIDRDPALYRNLVEDMERKRTAFADALNAAADAGLDIGVAVRPWPEVAVPGGKPRLRVLTMMYEEPADE